MRNIFLVFDYLLFFRINNFIFFMENLVNKNENFFKIIFFFEIKIFNKNIYFVFKM